MFPRRVHSVRLELSCLVIANQLYFCTKLLTIQGARKKIMCSYILRRPQNLAKSQPYFWLALHRTKVRWRFRKILWPSQNIWTLYRSLKPNVCRSDQGNSLVQILIWVCITFVFDIHKWVKSDSAPWKSHCNFFITEVKANNYISFQNHMTTNYALQFIPWQCQKNKNKVCMRHWRYKKILNSYPKRFPRNPFDLLSFFSASCTKAWAFASLSLMISQVFSS